MLSCISAAMRFPAAPGANSSSSSHMSMPIAGATSVERATSPLRRASRRRLGVGCSVLSPPSLSSAIAAPHDPRLRAAGRGSLLRSPAALPQSRAPVPLRADFPPTGPADNGDSGGPAADSCVDVHLFHVGAAQVKNRCLPVQSRTQVRRIMTVTSLSSFRQLLENIPGKSSFRRTVATFCL
jgi:hypothetical protein